MSSQVLLIKISQGFQSLVGSSLDFEQQQANLRTLLNSDAEATDKLVKKYENTARLPFIRVQHLLRLKNNDVFLA